MLILRGGYGSNKLLDGYTKMSLMTKYIFIMNFMSGTKYSNKISKYKSSEKFPSAS